MREFKPEGAEPEVRTIGTSLGLGILFLPLVFSWFTLRSGYSSRTRIMAFVWLLFCTEIMVGSIDLLTRNPSPAPVTNTVPIVSPPQTAIPANTQAEADSSSAARQSQPRKSSLWKYHETRDELRGTAIQSATLSSETNFELDFPYGKNPASIIVIRDFKGISVKLKIIGQFSPCSDLGCVIVTRFDSAFDHWFFREPSDSEPGVLVLDPFDAPRFLDHLRSSTKLILEAGIFEHGRQQVRFNVSGFAW